MTSKERMLTALARGVPDRAPATVHQWMPYHLHHYLDGIGDLDAFRRFGLDAASGGRRDLRVGRRAGNSPGAGGLAGCPLRGRHGFSLVWLPW